MLSSEWCRRLRQEKTYKITIDWFNSLNKYSKMHLQMWAQKAANEDCLPLFCKTFRNWRLKKNRGVIVLGINRGHGQNINTVLRCWHVTLDHSRNKGFICWFCSAGRRNCFIFLNLVANLNVSRHSQFTAVKNENTFTFTENLKTTALTVVGKKRFSLL